jgi:hypothetical protein
MIPNLAPATSEVPQTALDIGNSFVLLRARDRTARAMLDNEKEALTKYVEYVPDMDELEWRPMVTRWARLRLPNGQIARSAWKEKEKAVVRIARNVKVGKFSFMNDETY